MRSIIAIAILAIATPSVPSSAFAQTGTDIVVQGKEKQKRERKVCKDFDAPTGSRMGGGRVCRTAAEWRLAEEMTRHTLERQEQRLRADRAQTQNEKNGLPVPRAR